MEVLFLIVVALCAVASYFAGFKNGYDEGSYDGSTDLIQSLWQQGIINIRSRTDEEGNTTIKILNPNAPEEQE